jgi:hypothetical protein
MSKRVMTVLALLTALNLSAVFINWSIQARATVAGMDRASLHQDPDFRWAVEDVIQEYVVKMCEVRSQKIECRK